MKSTPLLSTINLPQDLRKLPLKQLAPLCTEIRDHLIQSINRCGGHFAGNLGTVEITTALHYVYQTPKDPLVWDVGHQAYPHKILTGRKEQLDTIKQKDGLSPFPKREESIYDSFGVGHSGTSISAALGMSIAFEQQNLPHKAVAIIGDGGLTGGMAFEALNHAGHARHDLLVILNDNDMSISPNVGALNQYLNKILISKPYHRLRNWCKRWLKRIPCLWEMSKRTEIHLLKGMSGANTLFEDLGFNYFGPVDGHDVITLVETLQTLSTLPGPKLLHIKTKKGKGFLPAEQDQITYHAVKAGFLNTPTDTSKSTAKTSKNPTFSDTFGQWLCQTAAQDKRLIAITPAMREGSGMVQFHQQYPKQYIDVGIAEQHAVTLAAGIATQGQKPVVAIYSTFLQRAYDQLIHDVAIQNLDVTFAIDRAGIVGPDGATHAGSFDLSYLRCIPNLILLAPSSTTECHQMLDFAYQHPAPAAVRYPRGGDTGKLPISNQPIELGKSELVRQGQKIAFLVFGTLLNEALTAAEELNATVVNMRFIKPLDTAVLDQLSDSHSHFIVIEDNTTIGGAGSAVSEYLTMQSYTTHLTQLGLPDQFLPHATREELLAQCDLTSKYMLKKIHNEGE